MAIGTVRDTRRCTQAALFTTVGGAGETGFAGCAPSAVDASASRPNAHEIPATAYPARVWQSGGCPVRAIYSAGSDWAEVVNP